MLKRVLFDQSPIALAYFRADVARNPIAFPAIEEWTPLTRNERCCPSSKSWKRAILASNPRRIWRRV